MPGTERYKDDLALMLEAAHQVADIAMSFFRKDPEVWYKNEGRSPVSEADIAVDAILQKILLKARPDYGWLSEENEDNAQRLSRDRVFVVDPIDGTRAFVSGRPDWCVSIGLIENGIPVAGVLAAPARKEIWQASQGGGAFLNDERLEPGLGENAKALMRVVIPDVVLKKMQPEARLELNNISGGPSLALRLAAVAKGEIDGVYIRPRSNEWDLAGADMLLRETGHSLVESSGAVMRYNETDASRDLLLAAGQGQLAQLLNLLPSVASSGPTKRH